MAQAGIPINQGAYGTEFTNRSWSSQAMAGLMQGTPTLQAQPKGGITPGTLEGPVTVEGQKAGVIKIEFDADVWKSLMFNSGGQKYQTGGAGF